MRKLLQETHLGGNKNYMRQRVKPDFACKRKDRIEKSKSMMIL